VTPFQLPATASVVVGNAGNAGNAVHAVLTAFVSLGGMVAVLCWTRGVHLYFLFQQKTVCDASVLQAQILAKYQIHPV